MNLYRKGASDRIACGACDAKVTRDEIYFTPTGEPVCSACRMKTLETGLVMAGATGLRETTFLSDHVEFIMASAGVLVLPILYLIFG